MLISRAMLRKVQLYRAHGMMWYRSQLGDASGHRIAGLSGNVAALVAVEGLRAANGLKGHGK